MNQEQRSSQACCHRASEELLRRMLDGDLSRSDRGESDGCGCSCGGTEEMGRWGLDGYPLAMVYAPNQTFHELYDLEHSLAAGTIFSELDLPFLGMRVGKGGQCG